MSTSGGTPTTGRAATGRLRLEEIWSRWITGGHLAPTEARDLATALAEDPALREELLADQRMEGALQALGRARLDEQAFARQFIKRVAAERDGRHFVSSVERRMRAEGVAGRGVGVGVAPLHPASSSSGSLPAQRGRRWTWALLLVPAAAAAVLIPRLGSKPDPAPVATPSPRSLAGESSTAAPAPPPDDQRPSSAPRHAMARLLKVVGTVFLLDHGTKVAARPGTIVERGRGLLTVGGDSRATLLFPDSTTVELEGDTALAQISDGASPQRGKEAFLARGRLTADVAPQPPGRPLQLTTPHSEATVLGTRFSLRVDATSTRLDVERGRVQLVRHAGGEPAVVSAAEFAVAGERAALTVIPRPRGTALLLAGNLLLSDQDELVKKRLESLGFEVRVRGGGIPDLEELRRASLVLISSSVDSVDINTQYREVPVPIIAWEPGLFDDLGMTGPKEQGDCAAVRSSGEAIIKNPSHPLAAGLAGTVQLLSKAPASRGLLPGIKVRPLMMTYGVPGPNADWIATWPGQPTRAVIFAYERGAPMPGLVSAPARRVGLFLYETAGPTEAGWAVFDAAALWAVEQSSR